MRILIDECLPRKLKRGLVGHDAVTVPEAGWASKQNGELLRLMEGRFDVFLTIDNNLPNQQKLANVKVAFIVLIAPNNRLETLQPLTPGILKALETIQPGEVVKVAAPPSPD
jgi:predicted nuclease of predicted toxin-antitoxin system